MQEQQTTDLRQRLLRRRVIIRQYDYHRLEQQALSLFEGDSLYDRCQFSPITKLDLEKQSVFLMLKSDSRWTNYRPTPYPIHLLERFKDYLYDTRYLKWTVTWDDVGYIWVQSRTNTPSSQLGWAVLEKDQYFND